uniref:hypothetical protein n=1 Tax=Gordonia sp. B7-2 TaxID=3420932 RepID=UPI003D9001DD
MCKHTRRTVLLTAAVLALFVVSGCGNSTNSDGSVTQATDTLPNTRAAHARNGATATVTLNSVRWIPASKHALGGLNCTAVELTINGTSTTPFKYDESYVTGTHSGVSGDDGYPVGGDLSADYVAAGTLPPLRAGQVSEGRSVHAFVILPLSSPGRIHIELTDPEDVENAQASWMVND